MACDVDDPNVKAFLKLIRYAEHYPDKSDNFYDTLYGGGRFVGYATHPNHRIRKWGHVSSAAGAYQITYETWREAKDNGVVNDFTPASQEKLALTKLRTRGALPSICVGDLASAYIRLAPEWSSLPGAGQSRMTAAIAKAAFIEYGGKLR